MYFTITVLSIISTLLALTSIWLWRKTSTLEKALTVTRRDYSDLQNQLSEHSAAGDKFQTVRQKIEFARSTLVPSKRWSKNMSIEEAAHTQGVIDALDWLEKNHARAAVNMRHVRT